MSARVFVAGGTGVLGRRVVPLLVAAGHRVTVNTRNAAAAASVESAGAHATTVDLFDPDAVAEAVSGHDAVVNVATSIPTGLAAARRRAWRVNDRLRTEGAANLARATPAGGRYVGESLTFLYEDRGAGWIDESVSRSTSWATASVEAAEQAAVSVEGVALRFAMFWAEDSAHHAEILSAARRGMFLLPGTADAHLSWVHIDDAAAAVLAALDAAPGVYNVAEPDPVTRACHAEALADAVGRRRLRQLPRLAVKLGGEPVEALARSHRIASAAFVDASGWEPRRSIVDRWVST